MVKFAQFDKLAINNIGAASVTLSQMNLYKTFFLVYDFRPF